MDVLNFLKYLKMTAKTFRKRFFLKPQHCHPCSELYVIFSLDFYHVFQINNELEHNDHNTQNGTVEGISLL